MIERLRNDVYVELSAATGGLYNHYGNEIRVGLRSGTELPAPDTKPQIVFAVEYDFTAPLDKKMYGKIIGGEAGVEYEFEISDFKSRAKGGDADLTALEEEVRGQGEQLQNCTQALDSSIVAYIGPQGISGNVAGSKDAINVENNIIESPEASFIFTPEGAFYIGEGYENIFINTLYQWGAENAKLTKIGDGKYEIEILNDNYIDKMGSTGEFGFVVPQTEFSGGVDKVCYLKKISSPHTAKFTVRNYSFGNTITEKTIEDGEVIPTVVTSAQSGTSGYYFDFKLGYLKTGDKILVELRMTNTSNKVPFVPASFRGGELKINGSFSSGNSTIIMTNINPRENEHCRIYTTTITGLVSGGEVLGISPTEHQGRKFDLIVLNQIGKFFFEDNSKLEKNIENPNRNVDSVLNIGPRATDEPLSSFQKTVIFDNILTEEKALEQLAILKNGNYQLPPSMQGTTFPIEGMARRADKYGIVNPYIFAAAERLLAYTGEDHDFEVLVEGESALKVVSVTSGVSSDPSIRVDGDEIVANVNLKKFRRI